MQGQRSDVVTARIDQAFERLSLFERRDVFPLQIFGNGEVFRFGQILARMVSHPASRAARKRLSPHTSE